MADTKITDLTEKATGAATDEFVINDVAGGNADKKLGMDGIRITESQITNLGTYLTDVVDDTTPTLGGQLVVNNNSILWDTGLTMSAASDHVTLTVPDAPGANPSGYEVTDSGAGFFRFGNNVASAVFRPSMVGKSPDADQFMFISSRMVDSGTVAAIRIDARTDTNDALVTKPVLEITNNNTALYSVAADGAHDFKSGAVTNLTIDANGTGNAITNIDISDLADGTDGELITWDAAGAPTTVAVGTATHVLTSNGTGAAPTFQVSTGGDTVIGTQVIEVDASALYPGGATPAAGLVPKQFGAQSQPIRAIQLSDGEDQEVYWQGKLNNWDAGTIKVKAYWFVENDITSPESKTFELDCSGVSLANFAGLGGTAYGTAITITDTTDSSAAEDKINISPASTAVTIAGAGAAEWLSLKMVRTASTDTAGNVFLAGISIEYTISTGTATI
ncbi:MAG: hypothetical protein OES34_09580 [Nitrosopumilus sp.]|nr:hypothetical protein [Nitrosopumilus sp.]